MGTYTCLKDSETGLDLPEERGWWEGSWTPFEYIFHSAKFDLDLKCFGELPVSTAHRDDRCWRPVDVEAFRALLHKQLGLAHKIRINGMCDLLLEFPKSGIYFSY